MAFAFETKYRYLSPFERIVAELARYTGIAIFVLVAYWTIKYESGYKFDDTGSNATLSTHPMCMTLGIMLMTFAAIMYRTLPLGHELNKILHAFCNLSAIVSFAVGLTAIVKWHNGVGLEHFTTFHSWIGIGTIALAGSNYLGGATLFGLKLAPVATRIMARPKHAALGAATLISACFAALTGLTQYQILYLSTGAQAHSMEYELQNGAAVLLWLLAALVGYVLFRQRDSLELLASSNKTVSSTGVGVQPVVAEYGNGQPAYGVGQQYGAQSNVYTESQPLTENPPHRSSYNTGYE